MKQNKIGTIFIVTALALAGIGVSYAGLTDVIIVSGTVDTATVDLIVDWYSGTIVWKIWDCPENYDPGYTGLVVDCSHEIAVYTGDDPDDHILIIEAIFDVDLVSHELVSWAKGRDPTASDPTKPGGEPYDAVIQFWNQPGANHIHLHIAGILAGFPHHQVQPE